MSDDFLNHEIWVSSGGRDGKARGTVKGRKLSVRALYRKLSTPSVDASITYANYMKLSVEEKGEKKAAPGFIMTGKFRDGRRKMSHFEGKSAVQIDIDNCTPEQWAYIHDGEAKINRFGFIWHTTRAHCPEKPRVRLIVPTDRLMDAEEANAITRLLSLELADDPDEAIDIPDTVSHKVNQIMYLPSISKNQEFLHGINDGPVLDVDEFLAEHPDWTDISKLPRKPNEKTAAGQSKDGKMEDPREKPGLIGAFCRAYDVREAIAEFIPDVYEPGECSDYEERYTLIEGSSSNGAIVYDDGLFLTSHHSSDPAEGTHNAFDLVRLHKFGHMDDDAPANTGPGNMPSFKAMSDLALKDERVKRERAAAMAFDIDEFEDLDDEDEDDASESDSQDDLLDISVDDLMDEEPEADDLLSLDDDDDDDPPPRPKKDKKAKDKKKKEEPWQSRLVLDKADQVEKTKFNAVLIVTNDKRIAPNIALNELSGGPSLLAPLRFPQVGPKQAKVEDPVIGRRWTDNDTAALAYCLSAPPSLKGYGRDFTNLDLQQAMLQAAEQNRYNPVLRKIEQTEWNGMKRVERFFIDIFGAEDNAYHRELARVWFLAAITRLMEPGHKFDLVPIISGKQGGGKSTVIEMLGMGFFGHLSGDFSNTQKMVESIRGKWILEVPELKGFRKGEIEDIKLFFAATGDTVRLAYRTNEEDFPRRCVFMGTTNEQHFLRDDENRRFCPVITETSRDNPVDLEGFQKIVPQLWAEALVMYRQARAEKPHGMLMLDLVSPEARAEHVRLTQEAREVAVHEPVAEVIQAWLDQPLSAEAVGAGGNALVDDFEGDTEGQMFVRNLVTTAMIRTELGGHPVIRDLKMAPDKVIGQALKCLEGWESLGNVRRCGRAARWWGRTGADDKAEFVPLEDLGPSADDLLG